MDSPELARAVRIDRDRLFTFATGAARREPGRRHHCGGARALGSAVMAVRAPLVAPDRHGRHVPMLLYGYPSPCPATLDGLVIETAADWARRNGCDATTVVLRPLPARPRIPAEHLPATSRWLLRHRARVPRRPGRLPHPRAERPKLLGRHRGGIA